MRGPVFALTCLGIWGLTATSSAGACRASVWSGAPLISSCNAGSKPSGLILQAGKDGNIWILNRSSLGGIGGQLFVKKASNSVRDPAYESFYRTELKPGIRLNRQHPVRCG